MRELKTLSDRALEDTPDLTDEELFGKKQAALHELWGTLETLVRGVVADPGPRVLDKLIIVHELTNPEYRRNPLGGCVVLETFISQNRGNLTYDKYLTQALSAFIRYAQAISPKFRRAPDRIEVNAQSVDRDLGF